MRGELLTSTYFLVGTQKNLQIHSSIYENVHGFVEALQNVLAKGSRSAQEGIRCCVLSNPTAGHQVSDIPEGKPVYQLSGMSALQHKYGKRIHGVL